MQEAILETLTKEAEVAKVQEAKEIPTVAVLDPPNVPERKSFPPRLRFMVLGTILTVTLAGFWLVAEQRWKKLHPQDPSRVFVEEIVEAAKSHWTDQNDNGSGSRSWMAKLRNRLRNRATSFDK
jgi:hypothetical protein